MKWITRKNYLDKLEKLKGSPDIKVITGMRRSGKSVLIRQFIEAVKAADSQANILSVDFTRLEFEALRDYRALHAWAKSNYREGVANYLFVDEVQMCEGFENAINSLHAANEFDIYLTGSNAFLLSSDLATLFTGRSMELKVFPFSFAEYRQYFGYDQRLDAAFDAYVRMGGLPGSYVYRTESERMGNLLETYNTIVQRDLVEKYHLGNAAAMQCISEFLMDNIGNLTSANNVCNRLSDRKVESSHVTAGNYICHLCHAFIFDECKRYDLKGGKYLERLNKYYLYDHGLRYAVLGARSLDYGRVYENIVYMELLRRGYVVRVGKLYGKEVDFVATRGSEKVYVQVSDDISSEETLKRELKPLMGIADAYPRMLIARTHHAEADRNGVRLVDLARWLAGDERGQSLASRIRAQVRRALSEGFVSIADAGGRGRVRFDFRANGGRFDIKADDTSFETRWSEAGEASVTAYRDGVEFLGIKDGVAEFPETVDDFESFDFTRQDSVCKIGDIVAFMNREGRFLAVKILDVQSVSRGDSKNRLDIDYRVY